MSRTSGTRGSKRIALLFAIACLAAAAPGLASASGPRWTPVGPGGGPVGTLAAAADGHTLYAVGDGSSFFRSADAGSTWAFRGAGPAVPGFIAGTLAVDPADSSHLLVAGFAVDDREVRTPLGAFESVDGAATWSAASSQLPSPPNFPEISQLAFDPRAPGTLYAATDDGLYVRFPGAGAWRIFGLAGDRVEAVAFDPALRTGFLATLATGAARTGIFKSTDGGETWVRRTPSFALSLAYDPADPRRVAGVGFGTIVRSGDGGATWQVRTPPANPVTLAFGADGTLYVASISGVYRSDDAGDHWAAWGDRPMDSLAGLVALEAPAGALVAAGLRGVWRSADRAVSWKPASAGIALHSPDSLTVAADAAGTVYFSDRGVFQSADHGGAWRSVNPSLAEILGAPPTLEDAPLVPAFALALAPSRPQTLYALGRRSTGAYLFLRSADGGGHWQLPSAPPPFHGTPTALAVDPAAPATVYVTGIAVAGDEESCHSFKSLDGGNSWSCLGIDAAGIAVDPSQPRLLAAIAAGEPVERSADAGRTWIDVAAPPAGTLFLSVVFDPADPNVLYFGSNHGVYWSRDGGLTVSRRGVGIPAGAWATSVVVDPEHPGVLYAGVIRVAESAPPQGLGAYRSTDGGAHWELVGGALPAEFNGLLALDAASGLLYAATDARGLYRLSLGR